MKKRRSIVNQIMEKIEKFNNSPMARRFDKDIRRGGFLPFGLSFVFMGYSSVVVLLITSFTALWFGFFNEANMGLGFGAEIKNSLSGIQQNLTFNKTTIKINSIIANFVKDN